MSRRQRTTLGRIARALVAAVAAGAALAGCSVTVEGSPQAAPAPPSAAAPGPTRPVPTQPNRPDLSDLGGQAAVYAEWIANGWVPRPILPVTDPASGVSASLFGTARRHDVADDGRLYYSLDAPASIINQFSVFPIPAGYEPDAERAASVTASNRNGRVVSSRPVTVLGYRGLDVRIEFPDEQGRPGIELIRYVELPRHLVGIESTGLASDERVLGQVQQIVADKLALTTV
jgi:hypothetical protein